MSVNIRNGGFERGNVGFWTLTSGVGLDIENVDVDRGSYSGRITTNLVSGTASLTHDDLVEIGFGEIAHIGIDIKAIDGGTYVLGVRTYDADQVQIGIEHVKLGTIPSEWSRIYTEYIGQDGVYYVSFYLYITTPMGSSWVYIDNAGLQVIPADRRMTGKYEIANLSSLTASDDTSGDLYRMYGFERYYAELECTVLAGTTPTLDVRVLEKDNYGNERELGRFTQLAAIGDQRIGIAPPIGTGVYVEYTEGGTWTACDFKVMVIGVR